MRTFSDHEIHVIEQLVQQRPQGAIPLQTFLNSLLFSPEQHACMVLQTQEQYAMYFLDPETFGDTHSKGAAIAKLMETVALLHYLDRKGYITLFKEQPRESDALVFFSTEFETPHIKEKRIILNKQGLYSDHPESIKNIDGSVAYQGVAFKDANYDLIRYTSIGQFYVSSTIDTLLAPPPKRKIPWGVFGYLCMFFLIALLGFYTLQTLYEIKQQTEEFNRKLHAYNSLAHTDTKTKPINYGIDISRWNGDVLKEVHSGGSVSFVLCKATEGANETDPTFTQNWSALKQRDMPKGAYHFYVFGDDPMKQAEHFFKVVGTLASSDFPPIVDIERGSLEHLSHHSTINFQIDLLSFLRKLEALVQRKPMIYTNADFADQHLSYDGFAQYPLWVADYSTKDAPVLPKIWTKAGYRIWQKSDKYDIHSTVLDLDLLNGDLPH